MIRACLGLGATSALIVNRHSRQSGSSSCEAETGIASAIGETKLIYLRSLSDATGCKIYGKAEYLNPSGSVKDRAAKVIIEEAEKKGLLKPGGTIVEGTGGNTGIALAALGASKGYKVVLTMPDMIAEEKVSLARRYGATVHLQPLRPFDDPEHYHQKAITLGATLPNAIHTNQFENLANYRAHYGGTAPEIWAQTGGNIDAFVAAAGT